MVNAVNSEDIKLVCKAFFVLKVEKKGKEFRPDDFGSYYKLIENDPHEI